MKTIILGGGCFWCIEAVYQQVNGVALVESGYAGGDSTDPTYHNHGSHAEVIQVGYDPHVVTLEILLEIFFGVHDPTTLNFQGNDYGEQYRSIIICAEGEEELVRKAIKDAQEFWDEPIVTEVQLDKPFYKAEDHHQDYFNQNQANPYCQVVINPKLEKFQRNFQQYTK